MNIEITKMEAGECDGDPELDGRGLIRVYGTVDGRKATVLFPALDVRAAHQILDSDTARQRIEYQARAELRDLAAR